jgi:phosphoenolpyruvate carboxylase
MCQNVSDILVMMLLLRLTGLIQVDEKGLTSKHDVCGLFETIHDLACAPIIINDLLHMEEIRKYIINQVWFYFATHHCSVMEKYQLCLDILILFAMAVH